MMQNGQALKTVGFEEGGTSPLKALAGAGTIVQTACTVVESVRMKLMIQHTCRGKP
jgi:hypothetical protein